MLSYATIAAVALMAGSAVADLPKGSATVINACSYPVYLCNVPSAYGGGEEVDLVLGYNGTDMPNTWENTTYTQPWTELTNGNGWSIKLYKEANQDLSSNVMQYEYTFHDDGTIWFDISDVNGNPWNADWEITTDNSSCILKQQAYRYSTDDAYGMQSCGQEASITVTLCSGESSDDAGAASASSVAASETSAASTVASSWSSSSEASPTPYSSPAASSSTSSAEASAVEPSTTAVVETTSSAAAPTSAAPTTTTVEATTLQTKTYQTHHGWNGHRGGITVTEVATAVVTEVVTSTYWNHPSKRHNHRRHAADRS